uniref:Uncharacterized protein n=1 Tax=Arundo donax TaxID=35708 RepID=A0A0A9AZA0_ARUDO
MATECIILPEPNVVKALKNS